MTYASITRRFNSFGFALFLLAFLQPGCGLVELGGGSGAQEEAPQGTVIKTGTFESFTSNAVSGLVEIIVSGSNGPNYVRLESFSIDDTSNLQLRAVVNGTDRYLSNLKGSSGSFNYNSGLTGNQHSWASVSIYSTASRANIATAVLNF